MIVDVNEVSRAIKPKADATLMCMRKPELVEYVRCLEHNYNVAVAFNENQARYIESLGLEGLVRCEDCKMFEVNAKARTTLCRRELNYTYAKPNGFCSYGVRRDATKHWLDNADSYICPVCGFETDNPNRFDCKCPRCGFMDAKDVK